jgi:hypothetical protein
MKGHKYSRREWWWWWWWEGAHKRNEKLIREERITRQTIESVPFYSAFRF